MTAPGSPAPPPPPPELLDTPAPPPLPRVPPLPVRDTVAEALRLVRRHPRETLLPMLAVQVPVAFVAAVLTTLLYFTAFRDEPFFNSNEILSGDSSRGQLVAMVLILAGQGLFAQVARAATISSVAGLVTGHPKSLSAALDPAFTRMGGLLLIAVVLLGGALLLAFSVVGFFFLPYLGIRFALSFEAYVVEELSVRQALARSWQLTRGHVLRIFGTLLLVLLYVFIPLVIISLIGELARGGRDMEVALSGLIGFVQSVLAVPIVVLLTAVTTLLYFRTRERIHASTPARI